MEQKGERHHEYTLIIYAASMPFIFMILKLLGFTGYYDSFPFSMTITEIFLVVIILRYRLFDAVMTAKDMVLEEIQEGIFVLDNNGEAMYSNRESNRIFPGINRKRDERVHREIVQFIEGHPDGFMLQEHFYKWQSTDIRDNNGILAGTMYRIMDMTDNYHYTQKLIELKEDAERATSTSFARVLEMDIEDSVLLKDYTFFLSVCKVRAFRGMRKIFLRAICKWASPNQGPNQGVHPNQGALRLSQAN